MKANTLTSATLLLAACLTTSCEHKELCYEPNPTVNAKVSFGWDETMETAPKSMSVYLFPVSGGKSIRYELTRYENVSIRIPVGEYDIICLNSDTRNIDIRNSESFSRFEIITHDASESETPLSKGAPRAGGAEDERIARQPETIYCATATGVKFTETTNAQSRVEIGNENMIRLAPVKKTSEIFLRIENIDHAKRINELSATLSEMAEGYHPANEAPTEGTVTLPVEMTVDRKSGTATAIIRSFGHCPADFRSHHLMIYAIMNDDSKYYFDYDISESLHISFHAEGEPEEIVLDELPIPDPQPGENSGGGGMAPTVDDWNTVNIPLDM